MSSPCASFRKSFVMSHGSAFVSTKGNMSAALVSSLTFESSHSTLEMSGFCKIFVLGARRFTVLSICTCPLLGAPVNISTSTSRYWRISLTFSFEGKKTKSIALLALTCKNVGISGVTTRMLWVDARNYTAGFGDCCVHYLGTICVLHYSHSRPWDFYSNLQIFSKFRGTSSS